MVYFSLLFYKTKKINEAKKKIIFFLFIYLFIYLQDSYIYK